MNLIDQQSKDLKTDLKIKTATCDDMKKLYIEKKKKLEFLKKVNK